MNFSKKSLLKRLLMLTLALGLLWLSPEHLYSDSSSEHPSNYLAQVQRVTRPQQKPSEEIPTPPPPAVERPSLITQAVVLTLLALFPFIIMVLTSFLKIVIVLSLLRSALGVQQAPPNQIINGVAFMLSLYIMYPTTLKMYDNAQTFISRARAPESLISTEASGYILEVANQVKGPMKDFLQKNCLLKHQKIFYRLSYRILPEHHRPGLKPEDFIILVPSFITSQLQLAFEIGVLIYIPFFVIDLVTSNILLAMGMMMLSPVTISMPIKLFLLVMLDGWTLLIEGLVTTFVH